MYFKFLIHFNFYAQLDAQIDQKKKKKRKERSDGGDDEGEAVARRPKTTNEVKQEKKKTSRGIEFLRITFFKVFSTPFSPFI